MCLYQHQTCPSDLGLPVLGICYGMQLMTDVLGGEVRRSGHREFGHAHVTVTGNGTSPALFADVPGALRVWASHGDDVAAVPPGFAVAATSATAPIVAMEAPERAIILEVLEGNNWNRNATADALGINRTTLYKKMKRLGLMEAPRHVRQ